MHMIMFVLDDPDKLDEVLEAWEAVGVTGATIFESTGIQRRRRQTAPIPARFGFQQFPETFHQGQFTLFTIVRGEKKARDCIAAVEKVVGSLLEPNTGVLAAWPLDVVKGVPDPTLNTEQE